MNLSKVWRLGGLIDEAIMNPHSDNSEVQMVQLGKTVVDAISYDWDSAEFKECVKNIEGQTGRNVVSITRKLKINSEDAVLVAKQFGAYDAAEYIVRTPKRVKEVLQQKRMQAEGGVRTQIREVVMEEIEQLLQGQFSINQLFDKVLEGIHFGVGMDRTLFSLLATDKHLLTEKIAIGWDKERTAPKLNLHVTQSPANLFYAGLQKPEGLWANPVANSALYNMHVMNMIGKHECFLLPVINDGKPIGLIYADRSQSQQVFSAEDFEQAKFFVQLGVRGLSKFRQKKL